MQQFDHRFRSWRPSIRATLLPLSGSPRQPSGSPWEFFIRARCTCYQRSSLAANANFRAAACERGYARAVSYLASRHSRYFLVTVPAGTPASPESWWRYICHCVHVHTRADSAANAPTVSPISVPSADPQMDLARPRPSTTRPIFLPRG